MYIIGMLNTVVVECFRNFLKSHCTLIFSRYLLSVVADYSRIMQVHVKIINVEWTVIKKSTSKLYTTYYYYTAYSRLIHIFMQCVRPIVDKYTVFICKYEKKLKLLVMPTFSFIFYFFVYLNKAIQNSEMYLFHRSSEYLHPTAFSKSNPVVRYVSVRVH